MKVTVRTRRALAVRREARDYLRAGWERCPAPVDEGRITDVAIGVDGKTIWIKFVRITTK